MAAPTFGAVSTIAGVSGADSVNCNYPSGIGAGDLLVAFVTATRSGVGGTIDSIEPPSGFTAGPSSISGARGAALFYKTATGSESGTIACAVIVTDGTATSVVASMARYPGVLTTGTKVESGGGTTGSDASVEPASVTTTAADRLVISAIGYNSIILTIGAISGNSGGTWTESAAEQSAATGAWTHSFQQATLASAGTISGGSATISGSAQWKALTLALIPAASAVAYTADLTAGSLALTGTSVTVPTGRNVALTAGSLSLTGTSVSVNTVRTVALTAGSLTLTGSSVTQAVARNAALTAGSLALTGDSISVNTVYSVALTAGSLSLSGTSLTPALARNVALTSGSLALTGTDLTAVPVFNYTAELTAGVIALTGGSLDVPVGRNVAVSPGVLLLTGSDVEAEVSATIEYTADLTAGVFALTGGNLAVQTGRNVALTPGALDLTGLDLGTALARNAALGSGSIVLTGSDVEPEIVQTTLDYVAELSPGVFVLTGSSITATAPIASGGKGGGVGHGFDPHYYKKRRPRKDKRREVERFLEQVEEPIVDAPAPIQAQVQEAKEAANDALRLETQAAIARALTEIDQFYALVRAEMIARRIEDEDDDEFLLLAA